MLTVVAVVETFIAPISLERKVEPATSSFASKFGRAHSHCCECESPHREAFAALKSPQAEPRRREGREWKREWRRQRNSFGRSRESSSRQATADAGKYQNGYLPPSVWDLRISLPHGLPLQSILCNLESSRHDAVSPCSFRVTQFVMTEMKSFIVHRVHLLHSAVVVVWYIKKFERRPIEMEVIMQD